MKPLVYLLEDDQDISRVIARTLQQQGHDVLCFRRLADFEREVARRLPDLALVDLILPDGDGMAAVRPGIVPDSVPKIIVTGRGALTDRVIGLEIGADDYIVKPFEPRELLARVRAVLRRTARPQDPALPEDTGRVRFGDWTADFSACRLTHRDGETVALSASEASLLAALVQSSGRVMSRSQLLDATTGRSDEPFDRSMDARISRLRRKLRDNPKSPAIIRTVYGSGYLFALAVKK
ncbi:MAG: response regulator transcription factor [Rhodobacteraceae bacterium]|nr:response regulator transcription factor [Paracoccaceae bacterium]